MHKGVIVLVHAEDKENALSEVRDFMEGYENYVWDWWRVGGRWSGILAPFEKKQAYEKWAEEFLRSKEKSGMPNGWISQSTVEENIEELQTKWQEHGLEGNCPYHNHYALPTDGGIYDAMPLHDCLDAVKDYGGNYDKKAEIEKVWQQMNEERKNELEKGAGSMSAYYADMYKDLVYENLSFQCNIYDKENGTANKIPDDINGYWAVIVDMHN